MVCQNDRHAWPKLSDYQPEANRERDAVQTYEGAIIRQRGLWSDAGEIQARAKRLTMRRHWTRSTRQSDRMGRERVPSRAIVPLLLQACWTICVKNTAAAGPALVAQVDACCDG